MHPQEHHTQFHWPYWRFLWFPLFTWKTWCVPQILKISISWRTWKIFGFGETKMGGRIFIKKGGIQLFTLNLGIEKAQNVYTITIFDHFWGGDTVTNLGKFSLVFKCQPYNGNLRQNQRYISNLVRPPRDNITHRHPFLNTMHKTRAISINCTPISVSHKTTACSHMTF